MAEAIVGVAIDKLFDFLIQEGSSLYGAKEEVERLQAELKGMRSFLKYVDDKPDRDERVRNFVAEIKSIAYDAEDIIENFYLKIEIRRGVSACNFKRMTSLCTKGIDHHKTANQINSLRTKLADIANRMNLYGIKFGDGGEGSSSTSEMQRRRSYPHGEEKDLITLEGCTGDLMAQLMRQENPVRVVSIVGMGGLGKTTLAKKVYNKAEVKRHFDCYSWVFISQQFSVKSVLLGILKDVAPQKKIEKEKIEKEEEVTLTLYEVLKEQRYLIVLDDIWQSEAWESLKPAFPDGKKGSKILFTTRIKEVASQADPWNSPIELPFLSDEESWTLLRNKVFPRDILGENNCISPEFEKLGREMVKKCRGLPLAIVVLGGLLAAKKSPMEWRVVHDNMTTLFTKTNYKQPYEGVHRILALSYHALPFHLKPCFLYFSVFREDSEINRKSLVRMWIAEGFVSQSLTEGRNETLEDVGFEYLEELISRSMIQVGAEEHYFVNWKWRKGRKTCRMHDLMRDMCVSKAREENFLDIFEDRSTEGPLVEAAAISSSTPRRVSFHCSRETPEACLRMIKGYVHLRALFYVPQLSDVVFASKGRDYRLISKKFSLLRVLHIEAAVISFPKEIGHLIHLRYFRWMVEGWGTNNSISQLSECFKHGLGSGYVISLPASLGNLMNLQALDLQCNLFSRFLVPDVLRKLKGLRHLVVTGSGITKSLSCRVDTLRNLETLRWIKAKFLLKNDASHKLTNLRHLGIADGKTDEIEVILRSPILGHLRTLRIEMKSEYALPTIEAISSCHHLSKIELYGLIFEDVHCSSTSQLGFLPTSLSELVLIRSKLKQDPMPILEKLPNLTSLRLVWDEYTASQMVCSAHGFPKLELLEIWALPAVEELRIEEGALPHLKTMHIGKLPNLKVIPEGLKFVTTLQVLDLRFMEDKFKQRVKRIDGEEGDDFEKVKHVRQVMLDKYRGQLRKTE